jgi:hypothetical protein
VHVSAVPKLLTVASELLTRTVPVALSLVRATGVVGEHVEDAVPPMKPMTQSIGFVKVPAPIAL